MDADFEKYGVLGMNDSYGSEEEEPDGVYGGAFDEDYDGEY